MEKQGFTWSAGKNLASLKGLVKRESRKGHKDNLKLKSTLNNANSSANNNKIHILQADVLKSLSLAILILSLELVIYLAWYKNRLP